MIDVLLNTDKGHSTTVSRTATAMGSEHQKRRDCKFMVGIARPATAHSETLPNCALLLVANARPADYALKLLAAGEHFFANVP